MKKIFAFIFPLALSVVSNAQQTGKLIIRVSPENAIVHVDGARQDQRMLDLKPGEHTVKIWAPERELYEQSVMVKSDSTVYVMRLLRPSEEYKKYYRALENYSVEMIRYRAITIGRIAAPLATVYFAYAALTQNSGINSGYQDMAKEEMALYNKSMTQAELDLHHNNFDLYNKRYKTGIALNYSSAGLMAGLTALLWIMENKRPEKPVYTETPLLSRLHLDVGSYAANDIRFTLHYTF